VTGCVIENDESVVMQCSIRQLEIPSAQSAEDFSVGEACTVLGGRRMSAVSLGPADKGEGESC